jgi:hypothetical protein
MIGLWWMKYCSLINIPQGFSHLCGYMLLIVNIFKVISSDINNYGTKIVKYMLPLYFEVTKTVTSNFSVLVILFVTTETDTFKAVRRIC